MERNFQGGQKKRGSPRVEDQCPQLEMITYFFFKLIFFWLKLKSLGPPFFSKHLLIHGIVNNSACKRLGEDWCHIKDAEKKRFAKLQIEIFFGLNIFMTSMSSHFGHFEIILQTLYPLIYLFEEF